MATTETAAGPLAQAQEKYDQANQALANSEHQRLVRNALDAGHALTGAQFADEAEKANAAAIEQAQRRGEFDRIVEELKADRGDAITKALRTRTVDDGRDPLLRAFFYRNPTERRPTVDRSRWAHLL